MVGRFGYFRLINDQGEYENEETVHVEDEHENETEWKNLFWRFYWRVDTVDD